MAGCKRCGACCTRFRVLLTPFDVIRLRDGLGLRPASFIELIPDDKHRARREPSLKVCGEPMLVALKKRSGGKCYFYSGDSCAAYALRPMLCRAYPFILNNGALEDAASRACPVKWRPTKQESKEYAQNAAQYALEVKKFGKIAREWNETRTGKDRELLLFLVKRALAASPASE